MQASAPQHEFRGHPSSIYDSDVASGYRSSSAVGYAEYADPQGRPMANGYHEHSDNSADFPVNNVAHNPPADNVAGHLLFESALLDSQSYTVLQMSEVDELKREQTRLASRLDAATRKLTLESKVKDAAQNLQRLYTAGTKNRPDTPQSPASPRRSRTSILSGLGRDSSGSVGGNQGKSVHQAQDELTMSIKRVDELNETIKSLQDRRATVDRKLLSHTAAVLAEQASRASHATSIAQFDHGSSRRDSYSPDEFDGIRDILHGKHVGVATTHQSDESLSAIHQRLENLNQRMRRSIEEVAKERGQTFHFDTSNPDEGTTELSAKIEVRIAQLERTFDQLNSEQATSLRNVEDAHSKTTSQAKKSADYETTIGGLWDIIQADDNARQASSQPSPLKEDFSLAAFSSRVQNLFDRAQSAQEQQDILRRQIQQQRDLNGRSDAEKDLQLTELQTNKDEMIRERAQLQEQLAIVMSKHAHSETEANHAQSEMNKVMAEFDSLQSLVESRQRERDEMAMQLRSVQQHAQASESLESEFASLTAERDEMAAQLQSSKKNDSQAIESLESEVARLTSERNNMASQLQSLQQNARAAESHEAEVKRLNAEHAEMSSRLQSHEINAQASESLKSEVLKLTTERDDMVSQLQSFREKGQATESLESEVSKLTAERDGMASQLQSFRKNAEAAESLETEVVRLTTELTMAKAELDGAYGTRAERKKEAEAANGDRTKALEQELHEMTTEFQELTRESVEMEKEREQLEGLIDSFRERCEVLETQLSEEKAKWIGMQSNGGQEASVRENTSIAVMRQEFKKMMREGRMEGLKALKTEQEERRRLETEVRRLRQVHGPLALKPGNRTVSNPSPT